MTSFRATYQMIANNAQFVRYFQADDLAHAAEQAIDAVVEGEFVVSVA